MGVCMQQTLWFKNRSTIKIIFFGVLDTPPQTSFLNHVFVCLWLIKLQFLDTTVF